VSEFNENLTWEEVREMAENGFEFGFTHAQPRHMPNEPGHSLKSCLRPLTDIRFQLDCAPQALAYPDGQFDEMHQQAGRGCALTNARLPV